jgi:thioredoxin-like negative regulator of GroEL
MAPSGQRRSPEPSAKPPETQDRPLTETLSGPPERFPHPLKILTVTVFLALTAILGFFPLKDTDFWWHLRTGDLIRSTGQVPHKDLYTYTVPDAEWIDLHWGFQVLISLGYQLGGVPLLNVAKAVITTTAVGLLLLGCRRRGWPIWVAVIAWLPALLVLSGRMYVRPETISLLWMSIVIWVVFRWRERPRYVWLLPVVFLFWVNVQGLFALGFVILAMGILDAALRPSMWRRDRRDWWARLIAACSLSVIACLVNPYGLRGLMFPLSLVSTMGNPVFRTIGELTPIPQFIRSLGIREFPAEITLETLPKAAAICVKSFPAFPLPLKLHLVAMVLGFLSFGLPLAGWVLCTVRRRSLADTADSAISITGEPRKSGKSKSDNAIQFKNQATRSTYAPFSLFRALMWAFFSLLSLKATRNSHQFAAVMGFVTATNLAEGAALFARASRKPRDKSGPEMASVSPGNAVALALVSLAFAWVVTGGFYRDAGEGRTIGWGEEPLWYPHAAVKAAGASELPGKFASFHNGHAALYDYYFGPERKVFSDARLEVIGAELYQRQNRLTSALSQNESGWRSLVNAAGRPVMLADHTPANSGISATLFTANDFTCIHFDPVAAVFAPSESLSGTSIRPFDFLQAHYSVDGFRAYDASERLALTRALRNISGSVAAYGRDDLARTMNLAGVSLALGLIEERPTEADHWKLLGQLIQAGSTAAISRASAPVSIDPVNDLAALRSIHALTNAVALAPDDFSSRFSLMMQQRSLNQTGQELESLRILVKFTPINTTQADEIQKSLIRITELDQSSPAAYEPGTAKGRNTAANAEVEGRAEFERDIDRLIASGQFREAAETLEKSLPSSGAPSELAEKLGVLRLWLGQNGQARAAFARMTDEPRRSVYTAVAAIVAGNSRVRTFEALDEAEKSLEGRPNDNPLRFAVAALKANSMAEAGELQKAKESLHIADELATTPGQRDFVNRLRRLVP